MRRPWYTYLLLFVGLLALLAAVFRPTLGVPGTAPGAAQGPEGRLLVRAGSPLDQAGVRTGDRFLSAETVMLLKETNGQPGIGGLTVLSWRSNIPRSGNVQVEREGRILWFQIKPAPPALPVRVAWWLTGLLNTGLVLLALALFWQRPRDGYANLLGITLLAAPVFAFPREPRLLSLALAAHFFAIFPPLALSAGQAPIRRRWQGWLLGAAFYVPLTLLGLAGITIWEAGSPSIASAFFDAVAVAYAITGILTVVRRGRRAPKEQQPVYRALLLAAGALLGAVLLTIPARMWVFANQFVPANLIPATLFSAAIGHLVFRLRALPVRLLARRTLQYLLARWTLGTLFLIPGFVLVWRLGQMSVTHDGKPGDVVPLLLWMVLTAFLLRKRQQVLQNLDRRFFRDAAAARQSLLQLAQDLGRCTDAAGVLSTLETGVTRTLRPRWFRYWPADVPHEEPDEGGLVVPVRRGDLLTGYLLLGPREDDEEYTSEDRQLLQAAGAQAAVALENARLSAALLARQREELTVRAAGVLSGAEEERRRLAADLHDQVLPELRQIAGEVGRLSSRANGLAPDLLRVEGELRETMGSVREVMEALRPSALDMLGLADALEGYLRKGAVRRDPPLGVSVRRLGPEPALSPDQSLGLYRIGQEAINNILKHSEARRAGLEVGQVDNAFHLCVWDDGIGLPPSPGEGHGLGNMRHRAELLGATLSWHPGQTGGTRVEVSLPLALLPEQEPTLWTA